MTQSPYVKSNFPRVPGDYYPTIDKRCIYSLLQHFPFQYQDTIFDVCAPQGSGIIETLKETGRQNAFCKPDAFEETIIADWIVTNPPYVRPLVDDIIERQIERVRHHQVEWFACLLRANFDFAKSRKHIFEDEPLYYGQIKMRFRPYWSDVRTKAPIHHFVWHMWYSYNVRISHPFTLYANGDLHE